MSPNPNPEPEKFPHGHPPDDEGPYVIKLLTPEESAARRAKFHAENEALMATLAAANKLRKPPAGPTK